MVARREVVPAALAGERIDRAVALLTGHSRADVARMVAEGAIRIGDRPVRARGRRLHEGEVIDLDVPAVAVAPVLLADPSVDLVVVDVDDQVVVVDKPAGLVVHPGAGRETGTLVQGLLALYPDLAAAAAAPGGDPRRPGIVHRLDKGTSGLLMVARTPSAFASLTAQLAARTVERRYLALVWGEVASETGLIDAPLSRSASDRTRVAVRAAGREARTRYEVLARLATRPPMTLVSCRLETGRTHQIRAHMAAIGHPVAGDERYGGRPVADLRRPYLHAAHLGFVHPVTGLARTYDAALPDDLEDVLRHLRAESAGA